MKISGGGGGLEEGEGPRGRQGVCGELGNCGGGGLNIFFRGRNVHQVFFPPHTFAPCPCYHPHRNNYKRNPRAHKNKSALLTVSGSTPTPWSGPFRDHGPRPWSHTPSDNPRNKGVSGPGATIFGSQTPRPRVGVDPCLLNFPPPPPKKTPIPPPKKTRNFMDMAVFPAERTHFSRRP